MSIEARRGSLVVLGFVLAGCSVSRNAVHEPSGPVADIPRTAPSAREQALKSIGREAPAPHLSAVMPRREDEPTAMESAHAPALDYHGLGINSPVSFEPMKVTVPAAAA